MVTRQQAGKACNMLCEGADLSRSRAVGVITFATLVKVHTVC